MTHRIVGPLVVAASLIAATAPAQARTCGERAKLVERLQTGFGETRTGAGMSGGNSIIEVFASEENGTWTIIVTKPSGQSCLVAAGDNWESGPGLITQSGQPT